LRVTDKRPTRQLQSTYQNTRQTLGFQKNIVPKIPHGGANVCLALIRYNWTYYGEPWRNHILTWHIRVMYHKFVL